MTGNTDNYRYAREADAIDTAAGPVLSIRPRGRCPAGRRRPRFGADAAGPDSEPTQPAQIRSRPVTALFPDDGRGPRAREQRGEMPLAPQRAVRPPSPEATCDLTPGDSCPSKLGPRPQAVNTPLWIKLWTAWENPECRCGYPWNTPVQFAMGGPVRPGAPGMTPSTACGRELPIPARGFPAQSAAVFMIPVAGLLIARLSYRDHGNPRGGAGRRAGLDAGQGWTPGGAGRLPGAGRRAGLGVWRD
jgi:hypothetical protein